ncbi:MAG: DMT family transporter, partial [Polyangiaceae bacterium]|nr:DMT family transporter [Polyangiaceae bacterium]
MRISVFGVAMVVLSAVCFSAKAIFAKLAYRHGADPSTVLMLRMVFALPFFALGALASERRGGIPLERSERIRLVLLGSGGYYLASLFDFVGLEYVSASLERLILFLYPTIVVVLNAFFFRERLSSRVVWALLLSYGGVGLVFVSDRATGGPNVALGSSLVFLGALAYAFYLAFSQPLIAKHGSTRVTSHVLVVA